ncbi:hypothetical protein [Flavobacterium sp.]|uniref:hypothetical protein n=1 Tax=Flavobacterium sp. TaxID=239 RepID=UPI003D6B3BD0
MPLDNLGKIHFSETEIQNIHQHLDALLTALSTVSVNLSAEERRRYAKVGEQNKLLINKVRDYQEGQPRLQSPEVDWEEFKKDYNDRAQASSMILKIKSLENMLLNIKILRDFDNYSDALRDYQYAKYKNRFADETGFSGKIEELKVFFPKTGKTKKKK